MNLENRCWVTHVREILCLTGFNFVWQQQAVGNVKLFLYEFKQRLVDMYIQEWAGTIRDKERFEYYRNFKSVFAKECYILNVDTYCFRVAISQVRLTALPINNNIHRYSNNDQHRNCPFCKTKVEDELHVLFECVKYTDLREKFLQGFQFTSAFRLLEASRSDSMYKLSRFIFLTMKRRRLLL